MNKVNKIYVKPGDVVKITAKDCGATRAGDIAGKKITVMILGSEYQAGLTVEHSFTGLVINNIVIRKPLILPLGSLGFYFDERGVYYTVPRQIKM